MRAPLLLPLLVISAACASEPAPEGGRGAVDDYDLVEALGGQVPANGWVTQALSVNVTSDVTVSLTWTGTNDLNVFLYDPSGALVAYKNGVQKPEVVTFDAAAPGAWVIGIKNKGTTATAYTLTTSVVPLEGMSESGSPAVASPTTPIVTDLNAGGGNKLGELSGMARSDTYPGFVWMHRDGHQTEDRREFFAMKVVGRTLQPFTGAIGAAPTRRFTFGATVKNTNWEELAVAPDVRDGAGPSIYIGDIGNNGGGRNSYQVYQFAEPNPTGASTTVNTLEATWKFAYPASAKIGAEYPNCESMFVLDRNIYIVTKESQPRVYRFPDGFASAPGTVHTLVPVVNGGTVRVVGATSNPSYAQWNRARTRFVMGNHGNFKVWTMPATTLTGDALVRRMLLDPANAPKFAKQISTDTTAAMNAEAATFDGGTDDVLIGTESKRLYHWPAANYER